MRWIALILALVVMLAIAGSASTIAYWGLTTPTFADCSGAGQPLIHRSQTYALLKDANSQTFNIAEGIKGVNLRIQVKTRSFLPLGLGAKRGGVSWVLRDPSGVSRWQESTTAAVYDISKQFDRLPGQWRLEETMDQHSGGYDICLKPL